MCDGDIGNVGCDRDGVSGWSYINAIRSEDWEPGVVVIQVGSTV